MEERGGGRGEGMSRREGEDKEWEEEVDKEWGGIGRGKGV